MMLHARLTIAALALAASAHAQESRGTIVGRITDQSGAAIAGAELRATNLATNVTATSKSNKQGNFVLPYLLPGDYTVHSSLAGFKKFVREGLQLRIRGCFDERIHLAHRKLKSFPMPELPVYPLRNLPRCGQPRSLN